MNPSELDYDPIDWSERVVEVDAIEGDEPAADDAKGET